MGGHPHWSQNYAALSSSILIFALLFECNCKKTVKMAKKNMKKFLNGPVRRQQVFEQETNEQRKCKEASRSKLTAHFLYFFRMEIHDFVNSSLRFSGLHRAVILCANCKLWITNQPDNEKQVKAYSRSVKPKNYGSWNVQKHTLGLKRLDKWHCKLSLKKL